VAGALVLHTNTDASVVILVARMADVGGVVLCEGWLSRRVLYVLAESRCNGDNLTLPASSVLLPVSSSVLDGLLNLGSAGFPIWVIYEPAF